jgi:hypothetical protein
VDILLWQFKVFQQSYSDFNFPEHPVAYNTSADNAMQQAEYPSHVANRLGDGVWHICVFLRSMKIYPLQ